MLVSANNGAVDENFFEICILCQSGKDTMPDATPRPSGKALIDAIPGAKLGRQIAPGTSRTGDPQHPFDKQPIVGCRAPRIRKPPANPSVN
jgi:hypothetical protein